VWIIVGNDGASDDDGVFGLMSLIVGFWRRSVVVGVVGGSVFSSFF